jgi:NAD(P)-dependent dehydrogenase (short-subunit alcohol dehydrogenase family)
LITGEDENLARRLGRVLTFSGALVVIELAVGPDSTRIVRKAARELGELDVLVNTGPPSIPEEGSNPWTVRRGVEKALQRSMSILVTATEAALPLLSERASVINTVAFSTPGLLLTRGQEALATAVLETTQGWAQTLGPRGIRVNAVVGGPRWDPELESLVDHGHHPEPPMTDAEELDAFVYLASSGSCHVSGSVLAIARPLAPEEVTPGPGS